MSPDLAVMPAGQELERRRVTAMAIRLIQDYGQTRVAGLRQAWDALTRERSDAAVFYQSASYFDHLAHRSTHCALSLAVCEDEHTGTVGIVPLWSAETALQFRVSGAVLGGLTFPSLRVLGGNPMLPPSPTLFRALFQKLSASFPACAVIELKGLPTSSDLWTFLRTRTAIDDRFFVYVPHGPRQCQWTEVPDSFDTYLARFKRKKRYNLKRQVTRLEEHSGGTLLLHRIERTDQVAFFAHALARLGRDGSNDFITAGELRDLAERGLLLSFVLTTKGEPCSLVFATRFGTTQLVHAFAHDAALDQLSPGTVLHTLMMRDLAQTRLARRIDYGFGEPRYRLGNQLEERVLVLLVRRTAGNVAAVMAHATFDAFVRAVKLTMGRRNTAKVSKCEEEDARTFRPGGVGTMLGKLGRAKRRLFCITILAATAALMLSVEAAEAAPAQGPTPPSTTFIAPPK